jgi:prephenate dehydratase
MSSLPESAGERPRVGYLGPAGTFSEEALLASADPETVEPVAMASIYETVMALRRGAVEWAIVPIENSLDGSISVTLDLIADESAYVEIVGETLLRVRHSLIAVEQVELEEIDTVLTHPQVPGQCERFLREELPRARVLAADSTAEAVRSVVADGRRGTTALGTVLAAKIYGGTVVRESIEDRADNETRFAWLARVTRAGQPPEPPLIAERADSWKTSIVFWGAGAESPGWLVRCLDEFAGRSINLTKIESRPRRERIGNYMFFVDLAGRATDSSIAEAIDAARDRCEHVRVLGSYPAAQPAAAAGVRN